jgi:hypothetical protein
MGTGGTAGTGSIAIAVSGEGAVRGRWTGMCPRNPWSPCSRSGWIEGSLLKRRCSHCFAVSCLLPDVENVLSVVGAVMFNVFGGAVGGDVVDGIKCY